ncbi:MAG: hypothetical protein HY537_07540 [Deltaproteobacteria bacterium]|nr:hypothetical protein [Deltaproteobacteria bacterium]
MRAAVVALAFAIGCYCFALTPATHQDPTRPVSGVAPTAVPGQHVNNLAIAEDPCSKLRRKPEEKKLEDKQFIQSK